MLKRELRAAMLEQRAKLRASEAGAAAVRLADMFLKSVLVPPTKIISAYYAMGDELNLAPLLERLHAAGYPLALPVMVGKHAPLQFRAYHPGMVLVKNDMGIHEPGPGAAVIEPDIVLVPLLAFDHSHRRLGYGGGYYDRSLHALRQRRRIMAIGIAYAFQQVDNVPVGRNDVPLDHIVTDRGFFARPAG